MTDPKEIEGTPERAADRGRADVFDDFTGKADLMNSPTIVEMLVRQFLGEVLDARTAYHKDEITAAAATQKVQEIAGRYATIFMTQADQTQALPWNSSDQLGAALANATGEALKNGPNAFFLRLAADFLNTVVIPHEEDIITEDVGKFRTEALVDDATSLLLGVPNSEQEEEP